MVGTIREIVLQAALVLLHREGLHLSPEDLTYANVFRYLDDHYGVTVTRGSVHERIWQSQNAFRFDVLKALLGHNFRNYEITADALDNALLAVPACLGAVDRADELCRLAGNEHFRRRLLDDGSVKFPEPHAISLTARPEERAELNEIHRRESERELDRWSSMVMGAADRLGLVPRAELGLSPEQSSRILAQLGAAALTGFCLDYNTGQSFINDPIQMPGPFGEPVEWTYHAITMASYQRLLFEPGDTGRLDRSSIRPAEKRPPGERPSPVAELLARERRNGPNGRRRRQDLRELVVAAAVEMVAKEGLVLRPAEISYKPVFDIVNEIHGFTVNRSSVHKRYWPDQEAFRHDVLAEVASNIPRLGSEFLAEVETKLPVARTPDGRIDHRQTLHDTIRQSTDLHSKHHQDDPNHRLRFMLKCSLLELPQNEDTMSLKRALTVSQLKLNQGLVKTYSGPMKRLGFEVEPRLGLTWEQAMFLMAALCTSVSLAVDLESMAGVSAVTEEYEIPRLDGSGTDSWSMKALSHLAITDFLFHLPAEPSV